MTILLVFALCFAISTLVSVALYRWSVTGGATPCPHLLDDYQQGPPERFVCRVCGRVEELEGPE